MKTFYAILCIVIASLTQLQAQAPQGFNYQATVRNSSGDLIVNTNVYFRFNIMQGSQTSLPVFTEMHIAPTDDLGQVNLVIGQGTATTGVFSELDWSLGSYYLGIELDTGGGYVAMGTTQLLSVPYALYAENSGNSTPTTPTLQSVLAENNSAGQQQIKDLLDPTEAQDAVTKNYAETQFYSQSEVDALITSVVENLQSQIDNLESGDNDGDGIPNEIDLCPSTVFGRPVDENGCQNPIYIDENGVTIKCYDWGEVGDIGSVNGVFYTIIDREQLSNLISNNENVSNICTTKIVDMKNLIRGQFNNDISNWDVSNVIDMDGMFMNSIFNEDISNWDVSSVTNMKDMFFESEFNGDISNWNVSNVNSMYRMFESSNFNGDISNWDVSSVTNMSEMFFGLFEPTPFNGDVSNWNVVNVTNMSYMFSGSQFNGDVLNWNVSNVIDMTSLFEQTPFNGDISNWNVSNVTKMGGLLRDTPFNGDISNWDVSNVVEMGSLFNGSQFNGDISSWNVSNVTNMSGLFWGSQFNGDISNWNVSNVTNMSGLFWGSQFNGDISNWDVSNVTDMFRMFSGDPQWGYPQFNQDISSWNVVNVNNMKYMFKDNPSFNQDLSDWDVSNVTLCEQFSINTTQWTQSKPNFTNCNPN